MTSTTRPATKIPTQREWKFVTNHTLVLAWLEQYPRSTARQTALAIGITERTAMKIIGELDHAGYLNRQRRGRRNVYRVIISTPIHHQIGGEVAVVDLLRTIVPKTRRSETPRERENVHVERGAAREPA